MPFTPFHLGPGAVFKAIGMERFSFMVFGGAQVLMDIEPGVRMLLGSYPLHGPTHSLAGAFVIGVLATLVGKPISELVLRWLHLRNAVVTWTASATGAFVGVFSHVVLDSMVHADMSPWAPLAQSNPVLGLVSAASLHTICLLAGVLGALIVFVRYKARGDVRRMKAERARS